MINNAYDARELARKSTDPKLQETLEIIEAAASTGQFSVSICPLSPMLINNLKARGFSVYRDETITW